MICLLFSFQILGFVGLTVLPLITFASYVLRELSGNGDRLAQLEDSTQSRLSSLGNELASSLLTATDVLKRSSIGN